jgi:hypothetical protein
LASESVNRIVFGNDDVIEGLRLQLFDNSTESGANARGPGKRERASANSEPDPATREWKPTTIRASQEELEKVRSREAPSTNAPENHAADKPENRCG